MARVIPGEALSGTFKHFHTVVSMENTGLTVLRYQVGVDEGLCWRLWIYNDHAHSLNRSRHMTETDRVLQTRTCP